MPTPRPLFHSCYVRLFFFLFTNFWCENWLKKVGHLRMNLVLKVIWQNGWTAELIVSILDFSERSLALEHLKFRAWEGWRWRERKELFLIFHYKYCPVELLGSGHAMQFVWDTPFVHHQECLMCWNMTAAVWSCRDFLLLLQNKDNVLHSWLKTLLLYLQLGTWFCQWPCTAVPAPWRDLGGCACWYQHPSYNSVWKPPWTTSFISLERASR